MSLIIKKKKSFVLKRRFSYMANACVRESMRARDIGMTCEHSCRNACVIA